jgi:hypothetical protein
MMVHRPTGAARDGEDAEGKGGNGQQSHGGSPVLSSVSTHGRKSSGAFVPKLPRSIKKMIR